MRRGKIPGELVEETDLVTKVVLTNSLAALQGCIFQLEEKRVWDDLL